MSFFVKKEKANHQSAIKCMNLLFLSVCCNRKLIADSTGSYQLEHLHQILLITSLIKISLCRLCGVRKLSWFHLMNAMIAQKHNVVFVFGIAQCTTIINWMEQWTILHLQFSIWWAFFSSTIIPQLDESWHIVHFPHVLKGNYLNHIKFIPNH